MGVGSGFTSGAGVSSANSTVKVDPGPKPAGIIMALVFPEGAWT